MKIAIFSDNFFPELSGVSDVIVTLVRELAKRGHTLRVYAPKYPKSSYSVVRVPYEEIDLGSGASVFRIFSVPYPTGSGQSRAVIPIGLSLPNIMAFKPDIIHTHQFFGAGIEALYAAKLSGAPLLGTNHTAVAEYTRYFPIPIPGFSKAAIRYMIWYYNWCALVTSPSQSLLDEMQFWGLRKEGAVLSNPIDVETFKPAGIGMKDRMRKKFNLSGKVILYTGRLAPEKSLDVLVRAFALVRNKVPSASLVFAGHGGEQKKLEALAESLGLSANVFFLGTLGKSELSALYQAADVFATPSISENQPLTLMQALASGLPVVGARARGLIEYIPKTVGFLFPPRDVEALSEVLVKVLCDDSLAESLGGQGRIYSEQFAVTGVVSKWEELYTSLISRNSRL